jgi:RNA polymerase sigma factor (sigma-70 family)
MDAAEPADDALAELQPLLLKLARLQLRNDAWAEDVVSETIIAAIEARRSFAGRSQFRTWVIGILKHKITDQLRRRLREVSIEAQIESGEIETFDELYTSEGRRVSPPMDWGDPQEALASSSSSPCCRPASMTCPPAWDGSSCCASGSSTRPRRYVRNSASPRPTAM